MSSRSALLILDDLGRGGRVGMLDQKHSGLPGDSSYMAL